MLVSYLGASKKRNCLRVSLFCFVLTVAGAAKAVAAVAQSESSANLNVRQVKFDSAFLVGGSSKNIDVSRFEIGDAVLPGVYLVDIYVNFNRVARVDVPFKASEDGQDAQPCFDQKTLELIGVDLKLLKADVTSKAVSEEACVRVEDIAESASSAFELSDHKLHLSIPHAMIARSARGYVSPDLLDSGVTAGMMNYDLNLYKYSNRNGSNLSQGYMSLNAGVNLGDWRFRHDGSYAFDSEGERNYQEIATYMQRDIQSLSSQLTIGDGYTSGDLYDSVSFRGIKLESDDRMLPSSLRGYAPTVRGVANSNAKVTVKQNGVTVYEGMVAPGEFEIKDLYATGYGGDLAVSVREADGSVHSFSIPYAAVPLSLRPGADRYSLVGGVSRDPMLAGEPGFVQATWQHGISNLLTGYAGITKAEGYDSVLLGTAFNTSLGAFGTDITQARTLLPESGSFNGSSVRASYSKHLPQTGTHVSIATYRYSTEGYFGLNDAMRARDKDGKNTQTTPKGEVSAIPRQRNRMSLSLSQNLDDKWGRFYSNASATDYWNRDGKDVSYSFGYNNSYKGVNYSLSVNRQYQASGKTDTGVYVNFSIPFGGARRKTITSGLSHSSNNGTQFNTTLTGSANNDLSYGVTANHRSSEQNGTSVSGSTNVLYRKPFAEFSGSAGQGEDYWQASAGIRGGVVAHVGGVTLSQPLSETIGIIEAPNAEGAQVSSSPGVRVDRNGYAVAPYLTPYSMNTVNLDPKGVSIDVELQLASQQVAPRAGSVTLLKYPTVSGRVAVIRASMQNGKPLPFGASVLDESNKEVGSVGQASRIVARGLQDKGRLTVKLGEGSGSVCYISYDLPARDKASNANEYQTVSGVCDLTNKSKV
jgi:outer membrane usher protein